MISHKINEKEYVPGYFLVDMQNKFCVSKINSKDNDYTDYIQKEKETQLFKNDELSVLIKDLNKKQNITFNFEDNLKYYLKNSDLDGEERKFILNLIEDSI